MKWFRALLFVPFTLTPSVSAQNSSALLEAALTTLPKCAITCLVSSVTKSSCQMTDFFCIAHNEALNEQMTACVQKSCTIREALTTKNFTETAYGLPIRDHSDLVSYSGVIGGGLALLAVMLRVAARLPLCGGTWGWDDWAILVAMIPVIPLSALSVVLANNGLGKDLWTVPFENVTRILHIYFYDEMLYLSSIALTKISILLFYLRIFPNPTFRKLVWIAIVYCAGYIIGTVMPLIFQCKPISLAWTRWDNEHPGKCINLNLLGWMTAALNIIGDLMTILLPLHELSKLAMSRRKKFGVMFMFLGGGFVTVVSMLRIKYMIQFANTQNVTWDYTPIGYWSTLEVHVGIIIACLPAVRALQRRIFQKPKVNNSYYLGPAGAYGHNSKGGSPFPSVTLKSKKGGHMDTTASQASMLRSRDDRPANKDFIQLQEFEFGNDSKPRTPESFEQDRNHGHVTHIQRGSLHTDDGAARLPSPGSQNMPTLPGPTYTRDTASPQIITVRKDYSVTVETSMDQSLSTTPPRGSQDEVGGLRGRRESWVPGLTTLPGARKRSLSRKRLGSR